VNNAATDNIDTVQSAASYTLGTNVDNLVLTGTANINGTGNALNNVITGNAGVNIIDGGAGADTMSGGQGNDTYYVDNAGDVITGELAAIQNGGTDTVIASVTYTLGTNLENLTLSAAGGVIDGTGNSQNNIIVGNANNNVLTGGAGADTLTGGAGADTFVLGSSQSADTITDFVSGTDHLQISMHGVTPGAGAGISIGNGNTTIESSATQTIGNGAVGFLGFDVTAELVVFTYNAANSTTVQYGTLAAAAEIGYANGVITSGGTRLFVVDDGTSSAVYLFTSDGNTAGTGGTTLVTSNELTLLATMNSTASTTVADFGFVA
ncbi:MAG: calcium-binding protein, partial [Nitrosomonadales bacterium]|nr:calcium-binding protein [Nitrosomonadales bacterium]